ncbi:hypothetical protein HC256_007611 [Beauveria bassiana]|nr:hypothetical protein HC256_007611 [Beauveria bassiana]
MVCCFAALQYTGCMHRSVFRIDCTRDCKGRCEPQELILEALVCVPCERCLEARADRRILERALIVKRAELLALELQEAQEGGAPCPPHFLYMTRTRVHENLEVASVEFAARLARASYAESWTFEVAELVWQLKHGKCKDVAAVKRKLNQLMKMSTWNLKVISKSSWTRDAVDSSEESNAGATNEDHNVGVTESAGTSADSLATTSISSTADHADSDRAARVKYVNVAAVFDLRASSSHSNRSRVITKVGGVSITAGVNIAYTLAAVVTPDPNKGLTSVLFQFRFVSLIVPLHALLREMAPRAVLRSLN